jgi:hypothetical protein
MRTEVVDWIHLSQDKVPVTGPSEHRNELSGFIKCGEFLD